MHTCTVELVLGSNPTGGVDLEKGALHVAYFIPVETEGLLPEVLNQAPLPLAVVFGKLLSTLAVLFTSYNSGPCSSGRRTLAESISSHKAC